MVQKLSPAMVAVFFATVALASTDVHAADTPKPAASDPYRYTAKAGDNYTVLARKAVQTYGLRENVKLSLAQIVAAETSLASTAGFPELNEGQAVSFDAASVKTIVETAKKITGDAEAAWARYVPYINFDTRSNG